MGIFRRSLAEDVVDRYTHTWAVLLLFLFSLVTLLLPLTPDLLPEQPPAQVSRTAPSQASSALSDTGVPRFKAACWCPAQFTMGHVSYSNSVCESAFNYAMIVGNTEGSAAYLYNILDDGPINPADMNDTSFRPNVSRPEKHGKGEKGKKQRMAEGNTMLPKELIDKSRYFVQLATPFYLFLFAVFLKIPHLVWTTLSSLVSKVNVDQILVSASKGAELDHQSRHQLHVELAKATAERVRESPWVASSLYLVMKLLLCVAVIAEVSVIHTSLLPKAQDLTLIFRAAESNSMQSPVNHQNANSDDGSNDQDNRAMMYNTGKLLLCDFKLRQMNLVHHYSIQCLFSPVMSEASESEVAAAEKDQQRQVSHVFQLYEALYEILLTYLIVLAVLNVASLSTWMIKLIFRPCRSALDSYLPLDGYFLLQMAKLNAGLEVATGLFEGGAWMEGKGHENIQLQE